MNRSTKPETESLQTQSAVVIGGGIAGLTAGWSLSQAGWDVRVLESGNRVGGAMQTEREGGYLIEHGPNTALESDPRITQLISSLGLQEEKRIPEQASKKRLDRKSVV